MKTVKAIIACLCAFVGTQFCSANQTAATLSVDLKFNIEDFEIRTNDNSCIEISSRNLNASYLSEDDPFLPWIGKSIEVPEGYSNDDFELTFEKRLIRSNVKMAMRPTVYPTSMLLSEIPSSDNEMYEGSYPARQCLGTGVSLLKGFDLHYFIFTPFYYDGENADLYFIDNITLSFKPSKVKDTGRRLRAPAYLDDLDIIKADAEFSAARRSAANATRNLFNEYDIDYLIVTNEYLKETFEPLIRWKTTKGLRSKIITVEEIDAEYTGDDLTLKIKQKLYELYQNNNLKYVLIGGDDRQVPIRQCYYKPSGGASTTPSDIYYCCFGGNFQWDENGNGIYGEISDNIDLLQSIAITRIPLDTRTTFKTIINRILKYEQNPVYENRILMGGYKISNYTLSHVLGDNLYDNCIKPYWDGNRHRLYDTFSDFDSQGITSFTPDAFNNIFRSGYSFVDISAHGAKQGWGDGSSILYGINDTEYLQSECHTLIVTISCLTNAFDAGYDYKDSKYPTLSQKILRSTNSGVFAYIGNSREGWIFGNNSGPSPELNNAFYRNLLSNSSVEKNIGSLVRSAKTQLLSTAYKTVYYRWVLYGLNPAGDPETPIFTNPPSTFSEVNVTVDNSIFKIQSNIGESKIAITDVNSELPVIKAVDNFLNEFTFKLENNKYNICLTKHNFIPYTFSILNVSINDIHDIDDKADYVYIGFGKKLFPSSISHLNGNVKIEATNAAYINTGVSIDADSQINITF